MNEINGLCDYAKDFSQYDRELHPQESLKDELILRHLNRSEAQRRSDLSRLDYLGDTFK